MTRSGAVKVVALRLDSRRCVVTSKEAERQLAGLFETEGRGYVFRPYFGACGCSERSCVGCNGGAMAPRAFVEEPWEGGLAAETWCREHGWIWREARSRGGIFIVQFAGPRDDGRRVAVWRASRSSALALCMALAAAIRAAKALRLPETSRRSIR